MYLVNNNYCVSFSDVAVVTKWGRRAGWFLVILINLFFVYFSVLRASQRSKQWQDSFIIACATEFICEVLVFNSGRVLWLHWAIPRLASRKVSVVINSLKVLVELSMSTTVDNWQQPLDTTDCFFVSKAIAKKYPHLVESSMVLAFHSYLPPGRMSNKWQNNMDLFDSWQKWLLKSLRVTLLAVGMLQLIGTLNVNIQNFMMSLVLPMAIVVVYVVIVFLVHHPIWFLCLAVILLYVGSTHYFTSSNRKKINEESNVQELIMMPWLAVPDENIVSRYSGEAMAKEQQNVAISPDSRTSKVAPSPKNLQSGLTAGMLNNYNGDSRRKFSVAPSELAIKSLHELDDLENGCREDNSSNSIVSSQYGSHIDWEDGSQDIGETDEWDDFTQELLRTLSWEAFVMKRMSVCDDGVNARDGYMGNDE